MTLLARVNDALVALDGTGENGAADAVALLRARVQPASPRPSAEEGIKRDRKVEAKGCRKVFLWPYERNRAGT